MNAFAKIAAGLSVPLAFLNVFGGVVAGVWLIAIGEWRYVLGGLLVSFLSTRLLGLALAPAILIAAPGIAAMKRGIKAGLFFFGSLAALYTIAIFTVWCLAVLEYFATKGQESSLFPFLLWSYGVATGPISYIATMETRSGGGEASMIYTLLSQVAFVAAAITVYLFDMQLVGLIALFSGIMLVGLIVQLSLLSQMRV